MILYVLMQAWVLHTLCHVLPAHRWYPYRRAADRWHITAAALSVLRAALTAAHAGGDAGGPAAALGALLSRTLSQYGALPNYLLSSLPPDAGEGACHMLQFGFGPSQNLIILSCIYGHRNMCHTCRHVSDIAICILLRWCCCWPPAGELECLYRAGVSEDVSAAAERCAGEWMRLLPALLRLPGWPAGTHHVSAALLQVGNCVERGSKC